MLLSLKEGRQKFHVPGNCQYHQVQLGFIIEKDHSRWLTNEEISNGVIEAINQKEDVHTVGIIEPREIRP
ncbi:hypothetical protein [Oceanobacillus arenosus]|uniref:hypothetical protein n=1 Tax=Oceanobacillus arenosus TaxID=1229153 RepID=UPI001B867EC7|nr:hypothetical protein [Oceanobacillus arenosus]